MSNYNIVHCSIKFFIVTIMIIGQLHNELIIIGV